MRVSRLVLPAAIFAWSVQALGAQQLGLNVHQSATTGLTATHDASLKWVRIDLNWYDAEPTQGQYDWARFDALIDGAKAKGLSVLAVVGYTPAWASSGDTKGGGTQNDVPTAGTYEAFVTAVVNRYKTKVTHYELWNEPNLGEFFEGTTADYTGRILVPGANAVHAACATCKVVAPGLASVGNQYDQWLDASLAAAKNQIDVVSGHIYAQFSQDDNGAGVTSDSFMNKLESHRVIKVGTAVVYEGPLSYREVMAKHGVTNKPFWLTESGRTATPGNAAQEDAQKLYYRRVLEAMLTRPWWEATIFYEAFDVTGSGYTWGICVEDTGQALGYRKKAVFDFLAKAASSQPAFGGNKTDCDDGLDNDGDGLVDFPADPDCKSAGGASEGIPIAPGSDAGADAAGAGTDVDGGDSQNPAGSDARGGSSDGGCAISRASNGSVAALAAGWLVALAAIVRRRKRARR